jgi:hypothetical protein
MHQWIDTYKNQLTFFYFKTNNNILNRNNHIIINLIVDGIFQKYLESCSHCHLGRILFGRPIHFLWVFLFTGDLIQAGRLLKMPGHISPVDIQIIDSDIRPIAEQPINHITSKQYIYLLLAHLEFSLV